jgi:tetratricopeptide (TPR) repeat protein
MEFAPSLQKTADRLFKSARYAAAIPMYEQALAVPPPDKDIFKKLSACHLELGDAAAATAHARQALLLDARDGKSYYLLARALAASGSEAAAAEVVAQGLTADPQSTVSSSCD